MSWFQDGAHTVHIFEAMGMMIKDNNYNVGEDGKMFEEWCMLCLEDISVDIKRRLDEPLFVLVRAAISYLLLLYF